MLRPVEATTLEQARDYLVRYRRAGDERWLAGSRSFFEGDRGRSENHENPQWHLLRAWHAQASHRFAEAADTLRGLHQQHRGTLDSWLMQANLARIQGDIGEAVAACHQVSKLDALLGQLCLRHARLLRAFVPGRRPPPAAASQHLSRIAQLLGTWRGGPAHRAWAFSTLSVLALAQGQLSLAAVSAQQAVALEPTLQRRVHLARVKLQAGDAEGALVVLDQDEDRGGSPSVLLVRLLVQQQRGLLVADSEMVRHLDHQFKRAIARNDLLHAREMATFYLRIKPEPYLAATLAEQNWAMQRELEDAWLLQEAQPLQSHESRLSP